ncbi:hypothetical protein AB9K41_26495, partial [Cribrihabitans sp. XS_ASV171]
MAYHDTTLIPRNGLTVTMTKWHDPEQADRRHRPFRRRAALQAESRGTEGRQALEPSPVRSAPRASEPRPPVDPVKVDQAPTRVQLPAMRPETWD